MSEVNQQPIIIYYDWLPDRNWDDCMLCGEYRLINHAVAFYEEPVQEEIGTVLWHGGEVGGMSCCKECHDKHYNIEQSDISKNVRSSKSSRA